MNACESISLNLREEVSPADPDRVRALLEPLAMFNPEEVDVAVSLARERLEKGPASGYEFFFLQGQAPGALLEGFACYGRIPCTLHSWDLYWIAVRKERRKSGLGRQLLAAVETRARQRGGAQLYAETSSLPRYASTRGFYLNCGFEERARFPRFYAPDDDKVVYEKIL